MSHDTEFEVEMLQAHLQELLNQQEDDGVPSLKHCLSSNLKKDLQDIVQDNRYDIDPKLKKADLVLALEEAITESFEEYLSTILMDREFPALVQLSFENADVKSEEHLVPFMDVASYGFVFLESHEDGEAMIFPIDLMQRFVHWLTEGNIEAMFLRTAYHRVIEGLVNIIGVVPRRMVRRVLQMTFGDEYDDAIFDRLLDRPEVDALSYFSYGAHVLHGSLTNSEASPLVARLIAMDFPYYEPSFEEIIDASHHPFEMEDANLDEMTEILLENVNNSYEVGVVLWHIYQLIRRDAPREHLHIFLKETDIRFAKKEDLVRLFMRYDALSRSARKWTLRGHTELEAKNLMAIKNDSAPEERPKRKRPGTGF